jgi:hypothetical protein
VVADRHPDGGEGVDENLMGIERRYPMAVR